MHILTTGGTIDKVYFDELSEFKVGDSLIGDVLKQANVQAPYTVTALMQKDSLELTDADREIIRHAVLESAAEQIIITHGTDTMCLSAEALIDVKNKTVVLCGSMQPARMQKSDAAFNIGAAFVAAQTLEHGVYIIMNGHVFPAGTVQKNRDAQRFENS